MIFLNGFKSFKPAERQLSQDCFSLSVVVLLTWCLGPQTTLAQGRTETIAQSGQAAPDGNGSFFLFGIPALNESGDAAFYGALPGTSGAGLDDTGIFRSSGEALTQIAREGQAAPDGNGTFSGFSDVPLIRGRFSNSLFALRVSSIDLFTGDLLE